MKRKITMFLMLMGLSLAGFSQYSSIKIICDGQNPGGLLKEVEEPGSITASLTTLHAGSAASPAWSSQGTIPFTFTFYGSTVSAYKVSTTGVLTFDLTAVAVPPVANASLPSASIPDNSVCIWGLTGSGANDKIASRTYGTAPNRQHWIWFNSYSIPGASGTQYTYWGIVFEETTNNIYLVDQRAYPVTGLSLTLGLQQNSTTAYEITGSPNINTVTTQGGTLDDPSDNAYYKIGTSLVAYDVGIKSNNLQNKFPYKSTSGGPFSMSGSMVNLGSTALTSIVLNYSINGGSAVTSSPITVNIPAGGCYNYTHPTQWNPSGPGWYNVRLWATNLNGSNNDLNNANDTVTAKVYLYNAVPATHKVVVEEATGTWCGWCPRGTVFMDSISHTYPNNTVLIAAHGGSGTEPMAVSTYATGMSSMVAGYPEVCVDRIFVDDPSTLYSMYAAHIADFGLADVTVSVAYNATTRVATASAAIASAVTIDGDYRLACVYTEDGVTGTGDGTNTVTGDYDQENYYSYQSQNLALSGAGHNWQQETHPVDAPYMKYDFVARALQGGFTGQTGSLPASMTAGSTYNYTFAGYTLPANFRSWKMKAHVLLIDAENNIIMNGNSKAISPVGIDDPATVSYGLSVYPNPASSRLFVEMNFKDNDKAVLTITDMLGKVCFEQNLGSVAAGEHQVPVNVSDLQSGAYFVTLTGANGHVTTKFIK